jgi:hypothetical protein
MNSVAVAILISMTDVARPILPALLRADPRTGLVVLSAANRAQPVGEAAGRVVSVVPARALLDVRPVIVRAVGPAASAVCRVVRGRPVSAVPATALLDVR